VVVKIKLEENWRWNMGETRTDVCSI